MELIIICSSTKSSGESSNSLNILLCLQSDTLNIRDHPFKTHVLGGRGVPMGRWSKGQST